MSSYRNWKLINQFFKQRSSETSSWVLGVCLDAFDFFLSFIKTQTLKGFIKKIIILLAIMRTVSRHLLDDGDDQIFWSISFTHRLILTHDGRIRWVINCILKVEALRVTQLLLVSLLITDNSSRRPRPSPAGRACPFKRRRSVMAAGGWSGWNCQGVVGGDGDKFVFCATDSVMEASCLRVMM